MKRVGIALGGGGVRGLAHVPALEVLDDLGVRPTMISGTSMGALVGAAYASGLTAAELRELCLRHMVTSDDSLGDVIEKRAHLRRWLDAFGLERGRGGLFKPDGMLGYLFEELRATTFEELDIPLKVVAADYWSATQVVFDSGDLMTALRASMAFPGVFAPTVVDGRVLIDGGVVNNVPYDLLRDQCDVVVAIDVAETREPERESVPGLIDAVVGAFDIMHAEQLAQRMKRSPPDVYVHPRITDTGAFDFTRAETVFEQAEAAMQQFRVDLDALMTT
jgi:NTE family protein